MGKVPTVDLTADPATIASSIDAACRDVGFFQVVGHGLDGALEADAWDVARRFFRLDLSVREALAIAPGDAYGYGSFQIERLAASLGVETPPDLKETFSIGPPRERAGSTADEAAAFVFSTTPWPAELPEMEVVMRRYYDALAELVERVMGFMAMALGMGRTGFAGAIDAHTSALRLLHYPDLAEHPIEPGQHRAGAHSDYGTVTLLRQDDSPGGLQVRDVDGVWHDVPAVDGAYVVNVGDALERWTNDRWRSTVHRVIVPPAALARSAARQSIAFFHNANWDAVIECLPGCLEPGEQPKYAPIGAGQHLMDKFRSTQ